MFRCLTFILLILFLSINFIYADTSLRIRSGDCDAQNTGAWPAFGCNMARTSRSAIAASMSGIKIQWTYNVGSTISGPVVEDHNQRIYFGTSSGYLYCLTATGKLVWRFRAQNPIGKSPVIDDNGKIYFGDTGGYLYSLFFDGNLQWRSQLSGRVSYSPGYDGSSTIYVITDQSGSRLYAHRVNEPSYKWYKYDSGTYCYCDVVVDSQARSYMTNYSSRTYYCWDRNGTELWHKTMSWGLVWGLCLDETNTRLYSAAWNSTSRANNIHALNPANGDSLWTYETANTPTVPVAIDSQGNIYFGDNSYYFYCLTKDGAQTYKVMLDDQIIASPVVDGSDRVIVPIRDGTIVCINTDGTARWSFYLGTSTSKSPTITKAGNYIIPGNDNRLYMFGGVTGKEEKEYSKRDIPSFNFSASPNPFKDKITFSMNKLPEGNNVIKIYDITGRILLEEKVNGNFTWNAKSIASGVFIVTLNNNDKVIASCRILHH